MYRTGDLCRFAPDGPSVHLGRIDRQLKVRGLRLEPAEVESVLVSHPAVTDCAVVVGPDSARLVAFVVLADGAGAGEDDTTAALTGFAADLLPAHGVPEVIVPVAELPITVNGKLDTAALLARLPSAERGGPRPGTRGRHVGGRVGLGRDGRGGGAHRGRHLPDVLRRDQVEPGDTFVGLGGHSLLAFKLLDECETRLAVKPEVTVLLTGTVEDVVDHITRSRPPAAAAAHRTT